MVIKKFLQKILKTISVTVDKKKQVFYKKDYIGLLNNKSVGIDVHPSSTTNSSAIHLELLKQISLSQLDKAILAARQIHYYPKHDIEKTGNEIINKQDSTKQKINVKVNAELLTLPAGLIAILDICNSSVYNFPKENKL